jgi:hypothetical protein
MYLFMLASRTSSELKLISRRPSRQLHVIQQMAKLQSSAVPTTAVTVIPAMSADGSRPRLLTPGSVAFTVELSEDVAFGNTQSDTATPTLHVEI